MRDRNIAIDTIIGGNLRAIRMKAGLSQEALADLLDLTFQQIQKYEKGKNRISCSTLYIISQKLNVPVLSFFHGLDHADKGVAFVPVNNRDQEALELYQRLASNQKKAIRSMMEMLGR